MELARRVASAPAAMQQVHCTASSFLSGSESDSSSSTLDHRPVFARTSSSGELLLTTMAAEPLEKLLHMDALQRKKTAALLFFGSLCGFLGFCFAWMIGFMQFLRPQLTEYFHIETFSSGNGYFPSTVSEMVHDPNAPAGKCFFAFEFIAAVFIFQSWYPWHLRNVYIGDDPVIPFTNLSWMMFRQVVPSTGMMIVATVTATPAPQATMIDWVCIWVHLLGAVMLFGGYWLVEAYTLGWGGFLKMPKVAASTIRGTERKMRKWVATAIVGFYVLFLCFQGLMILDPGIVSGRRDKWTTAEVNRTVMIDNKIVILEVSEIILVDTASGWKLAVKVASYVCEVCCGLSLLGSLLVIWWFSEERHANLREGLWRMIHSDSEAHSPEGSSALVPRS